MKLHSPKDVAAALGCSYITVLRRIKDGTIKAGRMGPRFKIADAELKRLLAAASGQGKSGE